MTSKIQPHNKACKAEARIAAGLKNLFLQVTKMQKAKETESIFRQQTLINLTLKDAILFVETSIDNPEPNKKLKKAAKRFIKLNNLYY